MTHPFFQDRIAAPVHALVPHRDRSISEDPVAIQLIKCCHGAGPAARKRDDRNIVHRKIKIVYSPLFPKKTRVLAKILCHTLWIFKHCR